MSTHLRNLGRHISTCSRWCRSTTVDYHSQDKRHEERVSARWTRFPIFSFLRMLQTYNSYYFLPKFLSCIYSSNALITIYPISIKQASTFPRGTARKMFVYFEIAKEFIFTDAMRHKYGKISYTEPQTCLMPN